VSAAIRCSKSLDHHIEVRAIERAGKAISSDEMGTYHKVASPTRRVLLYDGYPLSPSLRIFLAPLYADGMIIVYDKDREDCMSIPEAPLCP